MKAGRGSARVRYSRLHVAAGGCGGRGPYVNSIVRRSGIGACTGSSILCQKQRSNRLRAVLKLIKRGRRSFLPILKSRARKQRNTLSKEDPQGISFSMVQTQPHRRIAVGPGPSALQDGEHSCKCSDRLLRVQVPRAGFEHTNQQDAETRPRETRKTRFRRGSGCLGHQDKNGAAPSTVCQTATTSGRARARDASTGSRSVKIPGAVHNQTP